MWKRECPGSRQSNSDFLVTTRRNKTRLSARSTIYKNTRARVQRRSIRARARARSTRGEIRNFRAGSPLATSLRNAHFARARARQISVPSARRARKNEKESPIGFRGGAFYTDTFSTAKVVYVCTDHACARTNARFRTSFWNVATRDGAVGVSQTERASVVIVLQRGGACYSIVTHPSTIIVTMLDRIEKLRVGRAVAASVFFQRGSSVSPTIF